MKLLFIEDELVVRDNYRDFLSIYFNTILETDSAKAGFKIYQENSPDLIIMDIHTRDSNGLDIIKKIRKEDKNTKIIVLSAHKKEEYLLEAIELNLVKYLVKPIKISLLKEILNETIELIKKEKNTPIFLKDGFIWFPKEERLTFSNNEVYLTKNEIMIFRNFCTSSTPYFSLENIYYLIYNDIDINVNKVKMILKRLRKKTSSEIIKNTYGLGYKFNL